MYNPVILSGNPLCYFMVAVQNFFNPRTYTQIHTLTLLQGGGGALMEPLPRFLDMLQYFENDFAFSGKPLTFSTR